MDVINLVDFVKIWELFDKIDWCYEQIISDFEFWDLDWYIHIKNFSDLANIDKSKNTLFILDKLLIENILDFFDMKNFTVLDMNFWISWYGKKIWFSKFDIVDIIELGINTYEPLDLISMISFLEKTWKNYLRINNFDLPSNFVYDNNVVDVLSLENKWFSGDNFTIVTTGTMLPEIVRTAHLLNENWIFLDVIILNKLNFEINEDLLKNKNIIFVIDLFNSSSYEKLVRNKMQWANLRFIYPKYNNINTILDEYKYEVVSFDAISLFERIKELNK